MERNCERYDVLSFFTRLIADKISARSGVACGAGLPHVYRTADDCSRRAVHGVALYLLKMPWWQSWQGIFSACDAWTAGSLSKFRRVGEANFGRLDRIVKAKRILSCWYLAVVIWCVGAGLLLCVAAASPITAEDSYRSSTLTKQARAHAAALQGCSSNVAQRCALLQADTVHLTFRHVQKDYSYSLRKLEAAQQAYANVRSLWHCTYSTGVSYSDAMSISIIMAFRKYWYWRRMMRCQPALSIKEAGKQYSRVMSLIGRVSQLQHQAMQIADHLVQLQAKEAMLRAEATKVFKLWSETGSKHTGQLFW